MAKKLPKFKLTREELTVVRAVAKHTRCDETWFSIASDVGKSHSPEYDEIYDLERGYTISLQYGLKLLNESFRDSPYYMNNAISKVGVKIWDNLLKRIGV
jgi:hypothetical protein